MNDDNNKSFDVMIVGPESMTDILMLNETIFNEARLINRLDRNDLTLLLARENGIPVGFKVGYALDADTFYSAKGGTLASVRRNGIARALLYLMMDTVRARGYRSFRYDTFPNMHPGMLILGLQEGFRVIGTDYNSLYKDFVIRLQKDFDPAV